MSIRKFSVPLLSLFLLTLGAGFFSSYIPVRLHADHISPILIGAIGGAFYFGLVIGAFSTDRYIINVGHIRAFAAFASLTATTTLLHGLFVIPWLWIILRLIGGFAMGALYVVIESWLLVSTRRENRGLVLSYYMLVLYAAQSLGQFFLNLGEIMTLMPYVIVAITSSLSILPLALSKVATPIIEESSVLNLRYLFRSAHSGFVGSFISGLILGAIYSLLPLFITKSLSGSSQVSQIMAITILGGMLLQYPIGYLSDKVERRLVLVGITIATIVTSLLVLVFLNYFWLLMTLFFIFGGAAYTIYPVSISYACDHLESEEIIAGTQGLLLTYSFGASIGPLLGSVFMSVLGRNGLFIYFACTAVILTIYLLWRKTVHKAPPQEEPFEPITQNSPVIALMDPRGDNEE